jgi:hypothetical protein
MAHVAAAAVSQRVLAHALSSIRAFLVDAALEALPAAVNRDWARMGLDLALRHLTGKALDYWQTSGDKSALSATLDELFRTKPDAVEDALSSLVSDPIFSAVLSVARESIEEEIEPRKQRLLHAVVFSTIPSYVLLRAWAKPIASQFGLTIDEVIDMRATANSPRHR